MASRRDQLHSYQFMIQRVVAALVMRETDPAQSPFRRAAGAIFAGIMVASIAVAGFAVYGLWDPGGNVRWKNESDNSGKPVVVVEEETGATYVYMGGRLFPAENYTSAMLVGNSDGSLKEPREVSRNSIAGIEGLRMGPRIGIPGAPDSLPSEENLIRGDWTLCSQPKRTTSGEERLETVMVVGERPLDHTSVAGEGVMLVQEKESSDKYLIYHSHRFRIMNQPVVLQALSLRAQTPLEVGAAWLNALPEGQEIRPPVIPGFGGPSNVVSGATIGTLYEVESAGKMTHYVALKNHLAAITEFQAEILKASANSIAVESMSANNASSKQTWDGLLPSRQDLEAPPESANVVSVLEKPNPSGATCAIFGADGGKPPRIVHSGVMSHFDGAGVVTQQRDESGNLLASRVVVSPGKGAVIWTSQDPEDPTGGLLCLITDSGRYYPLSSQDVLKRLGYDPRQAVGGWMPTYLVDRLPAGPTLDPAEAARPVPEP
jgi:type VII secretion protein EccB